MTFDAELAAARAIDQAEADYHALIGELEAIEQSLGNPVVTGIFLADETCDHENSEHEEYRSLAYWQAMYRSACCAAGGRAEDHNLDINALMGRSIY